MLKKLKVIAVSSNVNSFGLREMVLLSEQNEYYKASANALNLRKVGDELLVHEPVLASLINYSFELVYKFYPNGVTPENSRSTTITTKMDRIELMSKFMLRQDIRLSQTGLEGIICSLEHEDSSGFSFNAVFVSNEGDKYNLYIKCDR